MDFAVARLPDDVALLHALILATRAERDAERVEKQALSEQNDRLRHIIAQLKRMQFGKRSEKLDPDQLNLALEDVEQAVAESEAEAEKADPVLKRARAEKRRAGRGSPTRPSPGRNGRWPNPVPWPAASSMRRESG